MFSQTARPRRFGRRATRRARVCGLGRRTDDDDDDAVSIDGWDDAMRGIRSPFPASFFSPTPRYRVRFVNPQIVPLKTYPVSRSLSIDRSLPFTIDRCLGTVRIDACVRFVHRCVDRCVDRSIDRCLSFLSLSPSIVTLGSFIRIDACYVSLIGASIDDSIDRWGSPRSIEP